MPIKVRVKRTKKLPIKKIDTALNDAIHDIGDSIFRESQILVPVDKGTLKKSGSVFHEWLKSTIGYFTTYAEAVHEGTKPHEIQPKSKKALAFDWPAAPAELKEGKKKGAKFVYRKVKHPGTKPQPFLKQAVAKVRQTIPATIKRRLRFALG